MKRSPVFCWVSATMVLLFAGWAGASRLPASGTKPFSPHAQSRQGTRKAVDCSKFPQAYDRAISVADSVQRGEMVSRIAAQWIAADPCGALDFARNLDAGIGRDDLLRDLLHKWALRDPAAAFSWSDGLADPDERRSARSNLCFAVAETDPRKAVSLALDHGEGEGDGDSILESLTMQWAKKEPEAVIQWAIAQPPGEWRERLIARTSYVQSKSDPESAACRVAEELSPGPLQDDAVLSILHQWALVDAEAASRWAAAFREGDLRGRALVEISGIRERRR